jgi:hypothetical protein
MVTSCTSAPVLEVSFEVVKAFEYGLKMAYSSLILVFEKGKKQNVYSYVTVCL